MAAAANLSRRNILRSLGLQPFSKIKRRTRQTANFSQKLINNFSGRLTPEIGENDRAA
jgi:hypothetical protein